MIASRGGWRRAAAETGPWRGDFWLVEVGQPLMREYGSGPVSHGGLGTPGAVPTSEVIRCRCGYRGDQGPRSSPARAVGSS